MSMNLRQCRELALLADMWPGEFGLTWDRDHYFAFPVEQPGLLLAARDAQALRELMRVNHDNREFARAVAPLSAGTG